MTVRSPDGEILPPAVIGFEDVLQGTALRSTVRAIEPTVCFRIAADDFMTMVSDNVLLAQSLFALLLANDRPRLPFAQPPRVLTDQRSRQEPSTRRGCCGTIRCCRAHQRHNCSR